MSILNKILAILTAIGGVISAIFYVLFQLKKDENQALKKDLDDEKKQNETNEKILDAEKTAADAVKEDNKKNEENLNKYNTDNTLDSFSSGLKLLRK